MFLSRSNGIDTYSVSNQFITVVVLVILVISVIVSVVILGLKKFNEPDSSFPINSKIVIQEGMNTREITNQFEENHVVKSSLLLYMLLVYAEKDASVQAGTYAFSEPLTTSQVVESITQGLNQSPLIKVTFPEGFRAKNLNTFLPNKLSISDLKKFEEREGYLYPDTYFISSQTTPEQLLEILTQNAQEKHDALLSEINSNLSRNEIIILASIIEREAKDLNSKKIVSGILQNRLQKNMPLQVDATFDYILDKESSELTQKDLEIDSPFNTYTHKGLPPKPISNPGADSLDAVLHPSNTQYLYYLTAADGTFHYARTFDEHKKNKAKYLN